MSRSGGDEPTVSGGATLAGSPFRRAMVILGVRIGVAIVVD